MWQTFLSIKGQESRSRGHRSRVVVTCVAEFSFCRVSRRNFNTFANCDENSCDESSCDENSCDENSYYESSCDVGL